jgi:VWFA-related protein
MSRSGRFKPASPWLAASLLAALAFGALGAAAHGAPTGGRPAQTVPGTPADKADKKAPGDEDFAETVTVNVVNVDVYVSDKKGRVRGLTKDDFQILEDGRPMATTNFLAVDNGKVVGEPATPAAAPAPGDKPAPPALPPGYEQAAMPEDQKLRLIVYIDDYNLKPFDRNRVMRDLRIFLDQKLHRGDQVMLVSYDREMHVRQPFTSDTSLINTQLLALERVSAQGVHEENDRTETLRQIDEAQSAGEAMGYARSYAGSTFNDISFTIDAMKSLVTSLAGLTGRKALVYVSDGLPMIAGEDIFYVLQNKFSGTSTITENSEFSSARRFEELTAEANADRVTFYTIDAAGLRVYSSTSAEHMTSTAGGGVYADSINISNMQSAIQMIAEKTGGVSIINTNVVGPELDKIAEDFNSFYSLGYTPPHFGDGRFHNITVKVKRKGVTVRHREGYRDKSVETRMSDGTLAALQFPFQTNPIGVTIEFGHPSARKDGLYLVPISVRIPLGKLALMPRAADSQARVRLFIGAMDPDGGTSEVQQVSVPIKVATADVATLGGKHFLYTLSLLMRSGEQKVAIGLRDDVGAQESYVTGELRVGSR